MQSKFVLIIVGAIAAVAMAFAGGYYISRQSPTQPQPSPQIAQLPASAPATQGPSAEPPVTTPAPPQSTAAPAPYETPQPVRRHHDYADREYESAAPPPPPPPPRENVYREQPDPFEGRFSEFPMQHSGDGSTDSPLIFVAQTTWGEGREADLRVSLVVPEPRPSDRGEFWREWGRHDRVDLMPEVTRGTPVVVTGSAAAIVTIDPAFLDLDSPAALVLRGPDGVRFYRSRDVAPARGASWDARGVRWIFAIDEDFYRMLRDGADAALVVRHRSRDGARDIQIPFSTNGFQDGARTFEWQIRRRINDIAMEWQRSQPGGMNPPPPYGNPPPPQPAGPPPGVIMKASPPPTQPAPAVPAAQPAPPPAQPAPPPKNYTPPPVPAPAAPPQPGGSDPAAKAVADFHPPTDNCGPQPAYAAADPATYMRDTPAQLNQASQAAAKVQAWIDCRQQWLASYQTAVDSLRLKVASGHAALRELPAGRAILADFQTAHASFAEETNLQRQHSTALVRARAMLMRQNARTPAGVPPPQP